MTLRDWFPKHLATRNIEVTDGTIAEYEREAERTRMPHLGDLPLDSITRQHVIDWVWPALWISDTGPLSLTKLEGHTESAMTLGYVDSTRSLYPGIQRAAG